MKNIFNNKLVLGLAIVCTTSIMWAQPEVKQPKTAVMKAATKEYEKFAYVDAIGTYERIAKKGYKSVDLFQRLGNSYYFNAQLAEANNWYNQLFELNQEVDAEYYYRYAQTLKSVGDYKKADLMLTKFNNLSGNDDRGKLFLGKKNYLEEIKANSGRFKIQDAGINSKFMDYGSIFFDNKLIFATSRETAEVHSTKFGWTGQTFTNLFSAQVLEDGSLGKPVKFTKNLNSKFNEDTPVFTKDAKTMYFTRNNYNKGKRGKDAAEITKLKIYKATFSDGQWIDVTELPFNSDEFNVAHPALSPDDKTLYFVSDMPGSVGQGDLYKSSINADGTFGKPTNLGKAVNTQGRETFPYVTDENELYFSTDGHPGLGGLDIFVSKIEKDGTIGEAVNIGDPINGKTDDFGLIMDTKTRTGFFTSNREGGQGFDDIYKFTETRKLACDQVLSGVVTDENTGNILPGTEVVLTDSNFVEVEKVVTDESGAYKFSVLCGKNYYLRGNKQDYDASEKKATIAKKTGSTELSLALTPKKVGIKVGDNIGDAFKIKMIYFDLDKSFVRKDAALELEKILDVMKQYPSMKIDVRSHTDSRATTQYNESLSDRRAKSTIAWLISNGIDASRLTGKGYGETSLINKCADDVECTDEEHQANRRSEFIILSM